MKIHHLNCGTFCPKVKFYKDISHCHCLLIESEQGLILIDAGISKKSNENFLLKKLTDSVLGIRYDQFLSAKEQITNLGFKSDDVRHILLTHLDHDHAGGIVDFPKARIHLLSDEWEAAHSDSFQSRYRKNLWQDRKKVSIYQTEGQPWHNFQAVRDLEDLPPEILLIPLQGHTDGHCGFAIQSDKDWLFHVGDAYFNRSEIENRVNRYKYEIYSGLLAANNRLRKKNLKRLQALSQKKEVMIFCSHDPNDFLKFQ